MRYLAPLLYLVLGASALCAADELPQLTVPAAPAGAVMELDGKLDEAAWEKAGKVGFGDTQVSFLWMPEGLYAAFRTTDTRIIPSEAAEGTTMHEGDVFEMFIDPRGDHFQYTELQMDAAGRGYSRNYVLSAPPRLTASQRLTPEFCNSELWRYDMPLPEGFQTASELGAEGLWTCEVFLPAKFLNRREGGGPLEGGASLHMNLARYEWSLPKGDPARKGTFHYWVSVEPGCPHISPTRMGTLTLAKP